MGPNSALSERRRLREADLRDIMTRLEGFTVKQGGRLNIREVHIIEP